jgi:hypothetical protein
MFGAKKSFLDQELQDWHVDCWSWLIRWGGDADNLRKAFPFYCRRPTWKNPRQMLPASFLASVCSARILRSASSNSPAYSRRDGRRSGSTLPEATALSDVLAAIDAA